MLVSPDTSPRDARIPGEDDDYDFGTGAGFYLDAEREPYSKRYKMYSYVTAELPELVRDTFPGKADPERQGIPKNLEATDADLRRPIERVT